MKFTEKLEINPKLTAYSPLSIIIIMVGLRFSNIAGCNIVRASRRLERRLVVV
jgi:hypothetical protein